MQTRAIDLDLPGSDLDVDLLDFDSRDDLDSVAEMHLRELVTGLPARPGVIR